LEGCKRCFKHLENAGVTIKTFISDRHKGIAKWIREQHKNTTHFYDIWHVAKSVTKNILKISKEAGCEVIQHWMKAIRRHLFWCATSTKAGFGKLIVAKWVSFLRHVSDIHTDHPDPLYKNCSHGDIEKRLWIARGTVIVQIV
jgi:solute carrier family 8 (sodium/calcium exchanger)